MTLDQVRAIFKRGLFLINYHIENKNVSHVICSIFDAHQLFDVHNKNYNLYLIPQKTNLHHLR